MTNRQKYMEERKRMTYDQRCTAADFYVEALFRGEDEESAAETVLIWWEKEEK
jgi:hypothetical protein